MNVLHLSLVLSRVHSLMPKPTFFSLSFFFSRLVSPSFSNSRLPDSLNARRDRWAGELQKACVHKKYSIEQVNRQVNDRLPSKLKKQNKLSENLYI